RRQIGMQLTTGSGHPRSAIADEFQVGAPCFKGADQIGAVQVAARFADGKENLHASCAQVRGRLRRRDVSQQRSSVEWAPPTIEHLELRRWAKPTLQVSKKPRR